MRRFSWWMGVLSAGVLVAGCAPAGGPAVTGAPGGASQAPQQAKVLRVGFFPGPYADQFKRGVQPVLEKQGYRIEATEFSNAIQPNTALMDGSLDVNIFQNTGFMNQFNSQNNGDLVEVLKIPSAPLGIYSSKYKSLAEMPEGAKISLPNDPTNLARAMVFLQALNILTLRPGVEPTKATEKDVGSNPKRVQLVPLDAPQIPRSLADVDYAAALGNHVIAAGMTLSEALALEKPAPEYFIIIVTRKGKAQDPAIRDLVAAYTSPDFKQFVQNDPKAKGFAIPPDWK
jgi:D-methionine transport system substrate-binding protein